MCLKLFYEFKWDCKMEVPLMTIFRIEARSKFCYPMFIFFIKDSFTLKNVDKRDDYIPYAVTEQHLAKTLYNDATQV